MVKNKPTSAITFPNDSVNLGDTFLNYWASFRPIFYNFQTRFLVRGGNSLQKRPKFGQKWPENELKWPENGHFLTIFVFFLRKSTRKQSQIDIGPIVTTPRDADNTKSARIIAYNARFFHFTTRKSSKNSCFWPLLLIIWPFLAWFQHFLKSDFTKDPKTDLKMWKNKSRGREIVQESGPEVY